MDDTLPADEPAHARGLVSAVLIDDVRTYGAAGALVLQQMRFLGQLDDAADGWVERSYAEWTRVTGLSRDAVYRTLHRLLDAGAVEVDGPANGARRWRPADPGSRNREAPGSRNREARVAKSRSERSGAPLTARAREDLEERSLASFDAFWAVYPRKVSKGAARRAWAGALRKVGGDASVLIDGAKRYRDDPRRKPGEFTCHASTWLNGERWSDVDEASAPEPVRTIEVRPGPAVPTREYVAELTGRSPDEVEKAREFLAQARAARAGRTAVGS